MLIQRAHEIIDWCRTLAKDSEDPDFTTRPFLSPPMRDVHARLSGWMERAGMRVTVDAAGNLRGVLPAADGVARPRRLYLASHLDSVPRAGAFDGVLGVVLAIALVDELRGQRLPCAIEVIGFSDEEGTRFGVPFIGSRALVGTLDDDLLECRDAAGLRVIDAIREYGLDPEGIPAAQTGADARGYLEFHIEQGPVLDQAGVPLAVVEAIVGQSRYEVTFTGMANHAGTTPMNRRRDALAGAAEWIVEVEREGRNLRNLVATVGRIDTRPNASNVIPASCLVTLDVRHAQDEVRHRACGRLLERARSIALERGLAVDADQRLDRDAVAMDPQMTADVAAAVARAGYPVHHMPSGAGHDAMIVAAKMPVAMLFLRSPGGISHHPDESVLPDDVAAALAVGLEYLQGLARA
jgi:allantoate deiminase